MAGYQHLTSSGVVDTSGQAIVVYGVSAINDGSASTFDLYNGTSAGGTQLFHEATGAFDFNDGVTFKDGCYVNFGAHIASATIFYERVG